MKSSKRQFSQSTHPSHDMTLEFTRAIDNIKKEIHRLTLLLSLDNGVPDDATETISQTKFLAYIGQNVRQLYDNNRYRTAETYRAAMNSFSRFLSERGTGNRSNLASADIPIASINRQLMEEYQKWMRDRGLVPNTMSFYSRILRANYNRAVNENLTVQRSPFTDIYTGVGRTVKRAVPLSVIRKLKEMPLPPSSSLDYARDMFLLSFYLRGMSFVDMAFLRKTDLQSGHITYHRRKTHRKLMIKWTDEMQSILAKYPENPTSRLLPIIYNETDEQYNRYRRLSHRINYNLHIIGRDMGLDNPLTLYVARHSWASAARQIGIPLNVISEGMGHDSEKTTQIYLATLDNTIIDNANSSILAELEQCDTTFVH